MEDQQAQRRHLYNGFGNGLSRAFELAVTPALFGVLGHLVDRWLGTHFVFALLLALFAIAGESVKMWFTYDHEMRQHEVDAPWRARPSVGGAAADDVRATMAPEVMADPSTEHVPSAP